MAILSAALISLIFAPSTKIVIIPSYCLEDKILKLFFQANPSQSVIKPFFITYSDIYKNLHLFKEYLLQGALIKPMIAKGNVQNKLDLLHNIKHIKASLHLVTYAISQTSAGNENMLPYHIYNAVREYLKISDNIDAIEFLSSNWNSGPNDQILLFAPIARHEVEEHLISKLSSLSGIKTVNPQGESLISNFSMKLLRHMTFEISRPITYIESEDEDQEAELIALQAQKWLADGCNDIAIVTASPSLKKKIFLALRKCGLESQYQSRLSDALEFSLLMQVLELILEPTESSNWLRLLFNNRFVCNLEVMGVEIDRSDINFNPSLALQDLLNRNERLVAFQKKISHASSLDQAYDLLKKGIEIYFDYIHLSESNWQLKNKLISFLDDIIALNKDESINQEDLLDWVEFLASSETLTIGAKSHIIVYNFHDIDYLQLENVIISDDTVFEQEAKHQSIKHKTTIYHRYLSAIRGENVAIIRAVSCVGVKQEKSTILSTLEHEDKLIQYSELNKVYAALQNVDQRIPSIPSVDVISDLRPQTYSVSAIEKLMRDPYCFYLQYLLKLRQQDKFFEQTQAKDFGILIHAILASIDLTQSISSALSLGLECANKLLKNAGANKLFTRYVEQRVMDFIHFIYKEYEGNPTILSAAEVKGRIEMEVNQHKLLIESRADRVNQLKDGSSEVIDFKTGVLPTQAQIDKGVFPQLPIEHFILSNNGFDLSYNTIDSSKAALLLLKGGEKNSYQAVKCDNKRTEYSLLNLFEMFVSTATPYFSVPIEDDGKLQSYAHLKRMQEWFDIAQ